MFISDTLSKAALPLYYAKPDSPEYLIFQVSLEESFHKKVEETNSEEAVFTDKHLEQIRLRTHNRTLHFKLLSCWLWVDGLMTN